MIRIVTIIILLFTFSGTANALTITGNANIESFTIDNKEIPINKLKSHTVTVYQESGDEYFISAGVSINERQVLTTLHGVKGKIKDPNIDIYVQQGKGMAYFASIVKYDEAHDLVLLDIGNGPDMINESLLLGDPEGDLVTIGHPHGNKFTITTGTLGHIERDDYLISLQMDIQSGNSGGGVINAKGELVGIIQSALDKVGNTGFMVGKEDIQNFLK